MKAGSKVLLTHVSTGTTRTGIVTREDDKAIYYLHKSKTKGWIELSSWKNKSFNIKGLNVQLSNEERQVYEDYIADPDKYYPFKSLKRGVIND